MSTQKSEHDEDLTTVPAQAPAGLESATGVALRQQAGEEEIPKGAARGAEVDSETKKLKPDAAGGNKPTGLQKEPAHWVLNGSVDPRTVGSPSGPVAVAAVATSPEQADELIAARNESLAASRKKGAFTYEEITEEQLTKMSAAEIRSIGSNRGYEVSDVAGRRVAMRQFLDAQNDDETLE